MGAEEIFEGLGLRLADLGKLPGDMTHRAVMLAQLRARLGILGVGGVAIGCQQLGEHGQPLRHGPLRGHRLCVARHHVGGSLAGEPAHGLVARVRPEVAQRVHGKIVVGDIEDVATLIGQREYSRRATSSADGRRTVGSMLGRDD